MRLIDPSHPFLRPAWRRWMIAAAPFAWTAVEHGAGNTAFAYLFAAIGGYLGWHLIVTWRSDDEG